MKPVCMIIGGAENVWQDTEDFDRQFWCVISATIAVKAIAGAWPGRINALATLHPEKLGPTLAARKRAGFNMDFETWAHRASGARGKPTGRVDRVLGEDWGGSSGLFAVAVALHFGFRKIVLAGIPIDARPHFNASAGLDNHEAYRKGWLAREKEIAPYVRSMSGWTSGVLGKPDFRWLME